MTQPSEILREYLSPDDILSGRFVIHKQIGAGAYGAIYLAVDQQTGEEVAIKALPPRGEGASDTAIGRFERELKVVRNLSHPGIVEVIDYGETHNRILYMVMEFIEGRTLEREVTRQGKFSVDEALSVTRQIASALHAAHGAGVIHRDLKPANIMLISTTAGYRVKVLDFGMAKLFARLGDESIVALTREGVAVGTPRYIAPEQARGSKDIGPWTDVYALGLLLYEMLTGNKAVEHDSVESAVAAHVDPSPLELPGLSEHAQPIQELVREMVQKDKDRRIRSAEKVLFRINKLSETPLGEPQKADPQSIVGPPLGSNRAGTPPPSNSRPPPESRPPHESRPPPQSGPPPERNDGGVPDPRAGGSPFEQNPEESLEVDWGESADGRGTDFPAAAREFGSLWGRRGSQLLLTLGGSVAGLFVALTTFMVIAAQFHDFGDLPRAVLGFLPVLIGGLTALGSPRELRSWHFLRNSLIYCAIGFLVAHLMGPVRMARQLWEEPTWFLDPFASVPGVGYVEAVLASMAQSYAAVIVSLFGSGQGLAG